LSSESTTDPANLARQLDEVTRRDAEFRLKTIQRFRELDEQLRSTRERMEALSLELGERNTYIHQLHVEQDATRNEFARIHDDLATYSQWLAAAEDETAALRAKLERIRTSWAWRYGTPLRVLQRLFGASDRGTAPPPPVITIDSSLVYYLHTSPFRIFRERTAALRGWVYSKEPSPITAVRARVGALEFIGRHGLPEPETAAVHRLAGGPHERPGFEIPLTLAPGRQLLVLEAQIDHREWRAFLATPVWVEPRVDTDRKDEGNHP